MLRVPGDGTATGRRAEYRCLEDDSYAGRKRSGIEPGCVGSSAEHRRTAARQRTTNGELHRPSGSAIEIRRTPARVLPSAGLGQARARMNRVCTSKNALENPMTARCRQAPRAFHSSTSFTINALGALVHSLQHGVSSRPRRRTDLWQLRSRTVERREPAF